MIKQMKITLYFIILSMLLLGCTPRLTTPSGDLNQPEPLLLPTTADSKPTPPQPTSPAEADLPPTTDETPSADLPAAQAETIQSPSAPREEGQMPIFLEVTQTTILKLDSGQAFTTGVGPAGFIYEPESNLLLLQPTFELLSTTQVLVGENSVLETPSQVFENQAIFQFPPGGSSLVQISGVDLSTARLTVSFEGQTFDLAPGESRTFKQAGEASMLTVITSLVNHGQLSEIQWTLSDGSSR